MKRLLSITSFTILILLPSTLVLAEECLKMATYVNHAHGISHFIAGVKKSFKLAGICIDYSAMPAKRVQRQIKKGLLDGEFVRGEAYLESMKDYVMKVPTPVLEAKGYIVSLKGSGFAPKTMSDIGQRVIGIVHGVAWHEAMANRLKRPHYRVSFVHLLKLLQAGRIDGFLVDDGVMDRAVTLGFVDMSTIHKSEPIANLSAYVLLHKKNRKFIDKLDHAIQQVKREGGFAP